MLPASTIIFGAWALAKGLIRFEHYDNLSGASNSAITTALADPRVVAGKPTTLGVLTGSFDTRSVSPNDSHENYLARMTGFITSTETAEYHFFVAYDDASRVYLSKDETAPDPAVDTPIVDEPACCGTFAEHDSGKPVTTAVPFPLVVGKKYAVLVLLKEDGGDWLKLAWRKSTDMTEATALTPIDAKYFATYVDLNAAFAFKTQPTAQVLVPPSTVINFAKVDFSAGDGGFCRHQHHARASWPVGYDAGTGTWTVDLLPAPAAYRPTSPTTPAVDRDGVDAGG